MGPLRRANGRRRGDLSHRERLGLPRRVRRPRGRALAGTGCRGPRGRRHRLQGQAQLQATRRGGIQPPPGRPGLSGRGQRSVGSRGRRRVFRSLGMPVARRRRGGVAPDRRPRRGAAPGGVDACVGACPPRPRRRRVHRRLGAALQRGQQERVRRAGSWWPATHRSRRGTDATGTTRRAGPRWRARRPRTSGSGSARSPISRERKCGWLHRQPCQPAPTRRTRQAGRYAGGAGVEGRFHSVQPLPTRPSSVS